MEITRAGELQYLLFTFIFTGARTPLVSPVVCPQLVVQDSTQLPGLLAGLVDDVWVFALQNKTTDFLISN